MFGKTVNGGNALWTPFSKEVWGLNIEVAKQAGKNGIIKKCSLIMFVFPRRIRNSKRSFSYTRGAYKDNGVRWCAATGVAACDGTLLNMRVKKLRPYGSRSFCRYFWLCWLRVPEAPGIGQNFSKISEMLMWFLRMIYLVNWGPIFGIAKQI